MIFRPLLTLALSFLLPIGPSVAAGIVSQGSNQDQPDSVVVVELFTSEGCSSCPPADALLRQIHGKQTSSRQLLVGISEHVTYWNSLGWRDPYSEQTLTDRQEAYSSRFGLDGPYTPQMVVNGREQFVGNNSVALERALRDDLQREHVALKILSSSTEGNEVILRFSLKGPVQERPLDIVGVVTDDMAQSSVRSGENSGRTLQHISVARSLIRVATVSGLDIQQSVHLALPRGVRPGGDSGHHLILFAQEQHQGAILGAAIIPI